MTLTPEDIRRRQELTNKLNASIITQYEAEELKRILEREQAEAQKSGDGVALILIGLLMLILLAFLGKKK